jgi:SPX domain protein involved in polyphosphate accumulation
MMQSIFNRYEKKYLITKEQGAVLQQLVTQRMVIDRLGEYLVQNLYYDTVNWDIVRESIEKPLYREKLRLRFYDQYSPESLGFLELKKKFDGIVYKRRVGFPLGELKSRRVNEIISSANSQISREIGFFLQNNPVSEKVYIAYKRAAYNSVEDWGLRVTFDKDIVFSLNSLDKYEMEFRQHASNFLPVPVGGQIIDENLMVLEIKTTGAMPLWLTQALSKNNIFPLSFSKFGVCYTRHIARCGSEGVNNVT